MDKSANQLYKESQSSLPFKEWIEREKDKGIFIKNQLLAEITGEEEPPNQNVSLAKFDNGIPKWVLISGVVVLVGVIAYNRYNK